MKLPLNQTLPSDERKRQQEVNDFFIKYRADRAKVLRSQNIAFTQIQITNLAIQEWNDMSLECKLDEIDRLSNLERDSNTPANPNTHIVIDDAPPELLYSNHIPIAVAVVPAFESSIIRLEKSIPATTIEGTDINIETRESRESISNIPDILPEKVAVPQRNLEAPAPSGSTASLASTIIHPASTAKKKLYINKKDDDFKIPDSDDERLVSKRARLQKVSFSAAARKVSSSSSSKDQGGLGSTKLRGSISRLSSSSSTPSTTPRSMPTRKSISEILRANPSDLVGKWVCINDNQQIGRIDRSFKTKLHVITYSYSDTGRLTETQYNRKPSEVKLLSEEEALPHQLQYEEIQHEDSGTCIAMPNDSISSTKLTIVYHM
jgi:hypothetical protein